ncbi:hypothetical protein D3C76_978530 [compost metagenome]
MVVEATGRLRLGQTAQQMLTDRFSAQYQDLAWKNAVGSVFAHQRFEVRRHDFEHVQRVALEFFGECPGIGHGGLLQHMHATALQPGRKQHRISQIREQ